MVTIENRSTDRPQDSGETGNCRTPEQPESGNTRSRESASSRTVPENSARMEEFESALEQFKDAVRDGDDNAQTGFDEPSDGDNDPSVIEMRSMARKLAPARLHEGKGTGPPVRHIPYSRTNGGLPFFGACLALLMVGGLILAGRLILLDRQPQIREAETSQNPPQTAQHEELSSAGPAEKDAAAPQYSSTDVGSSAVTEITEGLEPEQSAQLNSTIALVPATGGLGLEKETENTSFVVNHSAATVVEPVSEHASSLTTNTRIDGANPELSPANLPDAAGDAAADSMITGAISGDIVPDSFEKGQSRLDGTDNTKSTLSVEDLLARGHRKLLRGEITAARSLFHRVYKLGDSRGAEGMGMTFDPEVYERIPVAMFSPEITQARYWYEKSRQMSVDQKYRNGDSKN